MVAERRFDQRKLHLLHTPSFIIVIILCEISDSSRKIPRKKGLLLKSRSYHVLDTSEWFCFVRMAKLRPEGIMGQGQAEFVDSGSVKWP